MKLHYFLQTNFREFPFQISFNARIYLLVESTCNVIEKDLLIIFAGIKDRLSLQDLPLPTSTPKTKPPSAGIWDTTGPGPCSP